MLAWSRWLRGAVVGGALLAAMGIASATELWKVRPGTEAYRMIDWIVRSADHAGRPFAVVDKRHARIFVFDSGGRLVGSSNALLGATFGDHIVPGVGERAQTGTLRPDERTTPAGRFDSTPGINLKGEHVVWADYASAFAIHRLRPGRSFEARAAGLASDTLDDNRASDGCVVVPADFYVNVVQQVLGRTAGVVYVLPETRPVQELFGALQQ